MDAEVEPVFVTVAVFVLVCKAEKEDEPEFVFRPEEEYVLIGDGVRAATLVPVPEILSVVEPRIVLVIVAEPVLVLETEVEPVLVRELVLVRVSRPDLV